MTTPLNEAFFVSDNSNTVCVTVFVFLTSLLYLYEKKSKNMVSSFRGVRIICRSMCYHKTTGDIENALTKLEEDVRTLSDSKIDAVQKSTFYRIYNESDACKTSIEMELQRMDRARVQNSEERANLMALLIRVCDQQKKIVPHLDQDFLFMLQFRH